MHIREGITEFHIAYGDRIRRAAIVLGLFAVTACLLGGTLYVILHHESAASAQEESYQETTASGTKYTLEDSEKLQQEEDVRVSYITENQYGNQLEDTINELMSLMED